MKKFTKSILDTELVFYFRKYHNKEANESMQILVTAEENFTTSDQHSHLYLLKTISTKCAACEQKLITSDTLTSYKEGLACLSDNQ